MIRSVLDDKGKSNLFYPKENRLIKDAKLSPSDGRRLRSILPTLRKTLNFENFLSTSPMCWHLKYGGGSLLDCSLLTELSELSDMAKGVLFKQALNLALDEFKRNTAHQGVDSHTILTE